MIWAFLGASRVTLQSELHHLVLSELCQGAINVGAALVATEQRGYLRPRQTIRRVEKGFCNSVGNRVAHPRTEDVRGGPLDVFPQRQGGEEVFFADRWASVKKSVDAGHPHDLSLSPGDHRAEQPWPAFR